LHISKQIIMKKILLSISIIGASLLANAQVIFNVLSPSSLEGNYDLTYVEWGATPAWIPANAVTGELIMADPVLGCTGLTNASAVNGKIAVIRRGECEFGLKAFNAEDAGAIAAIIINNQAGGPIAMGAGAVGNDVGIPVIMISLEDGALLEDEILAGNVTAFIGNKTAFYENDLGIYREDIFYPAYTSIPSLTVSSGSDFSYTPSAWVKNFGSLAQTGATLNVTITLNGTELYNNTSSAFDVALNDSTLVSLPVFAPASYAEGRYVVLYTVTTSDEDGYPGDNTRNADFIISSNQLHAYARFDEEGNMISGGGTRIASPGEFGACVVYQNPNASALALDGLHFGIIAQGGASVEGEFISLLAWRWNDQFSDLNDPNFNMLDITFLGEGEYIYDENQSGEIVFAPIRAAGNQHILMQNNQRYIFCANTPSDDVFILFDGGIDYRRNFEEGPNPQPYMAIYTGDWGLMFSESWTTPAIGVQFIDAATVGLAHQDDIVNITPYPNPATSVLNIPLANLDGAATLEIVDVAGRSIRTENVAINGTQTLSVDVANIPAGTYLFNMNFENGKSSTFRVVISK
jgi:hypothetical protein